MATHSFTIAAASFDASLLPAAARQAGTPAFRDAVSCFLQAEFKDFGGHASIRVDDETIAVVWNPDTKRPDPMAAILEKLEQGRRAEGIQLLELLLSHNPNNPVALYNLGLALSDAGKLDRATQCLREAAALNPNDANINVALGVALGRQNRQDEAVAALREAARQDPDNPWAHRNLAALLMKGGQSTEAITHYRTATRLLPNDQISWLGLASACRDAGKARDAADAYRTAIEINPQSDLAEQARAGSNALSQLGFNKVREVVPRQDAVHYCLDALRKISTMDQSQLQNLTLDLAMTGRNGFEVQNPASRYRVKGLDGEFSGLAMVCLLYVAMRKLAPGTDIGFDLAKEYEQAERLFCAET